MGHSSPLFTARVYAQGVDADAAQLVNQYHGEIVKAGRSPKRTAKAVSIRVQ